MRANEVFVDCGAYDGDTIKIFLEKSGSRFDRVVAFEPDPINFQNLKTHVQGLPTGIREKIILLKKVVGEDADYLRFNISGTCSSHISMDGSVEVESVPLDSVLSDFVST